MIGTKIFFYISEFSTLSQEVMSHCCIVLNIINHLIDSSAPVIATTKTQTQVSQNAITNPNASPIKQIKAASIVQDITEAVQKEKKNETSETSKSLGSFAHSHHYMRMFENLRNVYLVQRSNLDS